MASVELTVLNHSKVKPHAEHVAALASTDADAATCSACGFTFE